MPTTSNKHVPNILTGHGTQKPMSYIMPPIALENLKNSNFLKVALFQKIAPLSTFHLKGKCSGYYDLILFFSKIGLKVNTFLILSYLLANFIQIELKKT